MTCLARVRWLLGGQAQLLGDRRERELGDGVERVDRRILDQEGEVLVPVVAPVVAVAPGELEVGVVLRRGGALGGIRVQQVGAWGCGGRGRRGGADIAQDGVPQRGVVQAAFPGVHDADETSPPAVTTGPQVLVPGDEARVGAVEEPSPCGLGGVAAVDRPGRPSAWTGGCTSPAVGTWGAPGIRSLRQKEAPGE